MPTRFKGGRTTEAGTNVCQGSRPPNWNQGSPEPEDADCEADAAGCDAAGADEGFGDVDDVCGEGEVEAEGGDNEGLHSEVGKAARGPSG